MVRLASFNHVLRKAGKSSWNLSNSSRLYHRRPDIEIRGFSIGNQISKFWPSAANIGESKIGDRRPGLEHRRWGHRSLYIHKYNYKYIYISIHILVPCPPPLSSCAHGGLICPPALYNLLLRRNFILLRFDGSIYISAAVSIRINFTHLVFLRRSRQTI